MNKEIPFFCNIHDQFADDWKLDAAGVEDEEVNVWEWVSLNIIEEDAPLWDVSHQHKFHFAVFFFTWRKGWKPYSMLASNSKNTLITAQQKFNSKLRKIISGKKYQE